ncbi:MAG TPA: molybdopterin cofactor-binding domain-containing protein, partial [Bryobacteraceae bacterium]|nr:molybdopterin cofactor-binding domain-containing protein [Bryobacteraceae bacterium]
MAATVMGPSVNRIDGRKKVTGTAQYAVEMVLGEMAFAVLVGSAKPGGRILSIDTEAAEQAPGVLLVMTHKNAPRLGDMPTDMQSGGLVAEERPPLADDRIFHTGQYIAMVVAERIEQATYAASLLKIEYKPGPFAVALTQAQNTKYAPKEFMHEPLNFERGNVDKALKAAEVRLDQTYVTPNEHPCALEPHAVIASWSNGALTIYNATQWVGGDRTVIAAAFKLPVEKVRVLCPFTGGMFGSKAATGGHVLLAAVAAKQLNRPV